MSSANAMQSSLFSDLEDLAKLMEPAAPNSELIVLAQTLPPQVRLGTCSWSCSGWKDLVWNREYSESNLSNYGLTAYNKHPLFRTVCIDHGFYDVVTVNKFSQYASQVEDDFRFMVKAPGFITDTMERDKSGRAIGPNAKFLNVANAIKMFVEPALEGLGHKLGVLVFQISPLPDFWLKRMPELIARLGNFLNKIGDLIEKAPNALMAVEVRNGEWLTQEFIDMLLKTRATYCLGLHAKMPSIKEQLHVVSALRERPLVCRWNLHPNNGAYGYEDAGQLYSPYNKIVDPDEKARIKLAQVINVMAKANKNIYVAISNKAEGSAPLSVIELAKMIR
jgi:uncharacterized protein YecE (DUF72 family)